MAEHSPEEALDRHFLEKAGALETAPGARPVCDLPYARPRRRGRGPEHRVALSTGLPSAPAPPEGALEGEAALARGRRVNSPHPDDPGCPDPAA